MEKKMTKKEYFEAIIEMATGAEREDIVVFAKEQIKQLDKKAAKAKEKAAEKKAEVDEIYVAVQGILTEENQTIDEITAQVQIEDITRQKVINRLTKLVNAGIAEKDMQKFEGVSRKIPVYKLVTEAAETTEDNE